MSSTDCGRRLPPLRRKSNQGFGRRRNLAQVLDAWSLKRRKLPFPITAAPAMVPASGAKNSTLHRIPLKDALHGIQAIHALVKNSRFPPTTSATPSFKRVFSVMTEPNIPEHNLQSLHLEHVFRSAATSFETICL